MSKNKENIDESLTDGLNEGTKLKQKLQERALKFMSKYEDSQTLENFAELLCWDLNMTYRNVLESYIKPMMRHSYLKYEGNNLFSFVGTINTNVKIKKGVIDKDSIEDKETATEYMKRKQEEKPKKEKIKVE